jgi:hypothetical protein
MKMVNRIHRLLAVLIQICLPTTNLLLEEWFLFQRTEWMAVVVVVAHHPGQKCEHPGRGYRTEQRMTTTKRRRMTMMMTMHFQR